MPKLRGKKDISAHLRRLHADFLPLSGQFWIVLVQNTVYAFCTNERGRLVAEGEGT